MLLLNLPTEILSEIVGYCPPARITETCHFVAHVAYNTPAVWCEVHLRSRQLSAGASALLCARLKRSGFLPLRISISILDFSASEEDLKDMWTVLTKHNGHIEVLQLEAIRSMDAGKCLSAIYPSLNGMFCSLKKLAVVTHQDTSPYSPQWPQLDVFLQQAMASFPRLQSIILPTHFDCLPVFLGTPVSLSHALQTLVLDGSLEDEAPSMAVIVDFLHHTLQLETIWLKTGSRGTWVRMKPPSIPRSRKNLVEVPIPLVLRKLRHLAVATPGAGFDLLWCIEAPNLRDLHLDGTRSSEDREPWSDFHVMRLQSGIKKLALTSPTIERLAITATYLSEETWHWLFIGEGKTGPPFGHLESLSLSELGPLIPEHAGFDESILLQLADHNSMILKKLSIRRCTFNLNGRTLVLIFENFVRRVPSTSYELEIDSSCQGVTEEHLDLLAAAGVLVKRLGELGMHEWWEEGLNIDPRDSYAF